MTYRDPGEPLVLLRSVEVHLFKEPDRFRQPRGHGNQSWTADKPYYMVIFRNTTQTTYRFLDSTVSASVSKNISRF
jgi:hypothetical protein